MFVGIFLKKINLKNKLKLKKKTKQKQKTSMMIVIFGYMRKCAGSCGEVTRESAVVYGWHFCLDRYPPLHVGTNRTDGNILEIFFQSFAKHLDQVTKLYYVLTFV